MTDNHILSKQRLNDNQFFARMDQDQRADYLAQMMKTLQSEGIPNIKHVKFIKSSQLVFQDHKLHYNYIQKTNTPKSLLFFFHGMYCHSNHGALLGQIVARNNNTNIYGLDFLNAGRSDNNEPGYYKSIDYCVQQALFFIKFVLNKYPNKPQKIFISGHSMGGLVCFYLAVRYPYLISGIIFLAPALREIKGDRVIVKKIGQCLGCIFPKASIIPQTFDDRTRYKIDHILKEDKDCYSGSHVFATTLGVIQGMHWAEQNFKLLKTPYILFQGGMDKYCDPFLAIDLQNQSSSTDKTTVYYKNVWHELPNEPEYEQICEYASKWLNKRI